MPLLRFEKMPEDKKENILEAAAMEFAANGYEKASMNRILERAGISKGAAYYYFEDKADLIATVVRHYWLQFLEEPDALFTKFQAEDYWQKIEELYLNPFIDLEERPWMLGLGRAVWELPEEIRTTGPLGAVFDEAMVWVRGLVQRGRELGVMRDDLPEELMMQLLMALDSVHDRWMGAHWEEMDRSEREQFTRIFVDFHRKALGKPYETAGESGEGGLAS